MSLLCKVGLHKKVESSRAPWFMETVEPMEVVAFKCAKCGKHLPDGLLVPKGATV